MCVVQPNLLQNRLRYNRTTLKPYVSSWRYANFTNSRISRGLFFFTLRIISKKKSQYLLKTKYSNSHQERYKNKTYPNSHQERYKNKLKTSQQQKKSTTLIAIARCTCYMCLWFFCTHIWRNRLCCTVFTAYRAHVAEVMSSLFQSLFWQQNLRFKHGFALILQNEILLYIYLCLLGSHVFGFQ